MKQSLFILFGIYLLLSLQLSQCGVHIINSGEVEQSIMNQQNQDVFVKTKNNILIKYRTKNGVLEPIFSKKIQENLKILTIFQDNLVILGKMNDQLELIILNEANQNNFDRIALNFTKYENQGANENKIRHQITDSSILFYNNQEIIEYEFSRGITQKFNIYSENQRNIQLNLVKQSNSNDNLILLQQKKSFTCVSYFKKSLQVKEQQVEYIYNITHENYNPQSIKSFSCLKGFVQISSVGILFFSEVNNKFTRKFIEIPSEQTIQDCQCFENNKLMMFQVKEGKSLFWKIISLEEDEEGKEIKLFEIKHVNIKTPYSFMKFHPVGYDKIVITTVKNGNNIFSQMYDSEKNQLFVLGRYSNFGKQFIFDKESVVFQEEGEENRKKVKIFARDMQANVYLIELWNRQGKVLDFIENDIKGVQEMIYIRNNKEISLHRDRFSRKYHFQKQKNDQEIDQYEGYANIIKELKLKSELFIPSLISAFSPNKAWHLSRNLFEGFMSRIELNYSEFFKSLTNLDKKLLNAMFKTKEQNQYYYNRKYQSNNIFDLVEFRSMKEIKVKLKEMRNDFINTTLTQAQINQYELEQQALLYTTDNKIVSVNIKSNKRQLIFDVGQEITKQFRFKLQKPDPYNLKLLFFENIEGSIDSNGKILMALKEENNKNQNLIWFFGFDLSSQKLISLGHIIQKSEFKNFIEVQDNSIYLEFEQGITKFMILDGKITSDDDPEQEKDGEREEEDGEEISRIPKKEHIERKQEQNNYYGEYKNEYRKGERNKLRLIQKIDSSSQDRVWYQSQLLERDLKVYAFKNEEDSSLKLELYSHKENLLIREFLIGNIDFQQKLQIEMSQNNIFILYNNLNNNKWVIHRIELGIQMEIQSSHIWEQTILNINNFLKSLYIPNYTVKQQSLLQEQLQDIQFLIDHLKHKETQYLLPQTLQNIQYFGVVISQNDLYKNIVILENNKVYKVKFSSLQLEEEKGMFSWKNLKIYDWIYGSSSSSDEFQKQLTESDIVPVSLSRDEQTVLTDRNLVAGSFKNMKISHTKMDSLSYISFYGNDFISFEFENSSCDNRLPDLYDNNRQIEIFGIQITGGMGILSAVFVSSLFISGFILFKIYQQL